MATGISVAEFARRDGCSVNTVIGKGIKQGRLTVYPDKTLDPAQVGTLWREGNDPTNPGYRPRKNAHIIEQREQAQRQSQTADPGPQSSVVPDSLLGLVRPGESAEEAANRLSKSMSPYTHHEAARIKENMLALMRRLEFEQASGKLTPNEEVEKIISNQHARIRSRLLAIPSEAAPRVFHLKSMAEVQDVLQSVVTEALEELSKDDDE